MKVVVEDGAFAASGFRNGKRIRFADIVSVAAEKMDKLTYEELFLIIRSSTGEGVAVGELDQGFADFERSLTHHLNGFPTDWHAAAEQSQAGIRKEIWVVR